MSSDTTKQLKRLLGKPLVEFERFHNKTKLKSFPTDDSSNWPEEWKKVYFKSYVRAPSIALPKVESLRLSLEEALKNRFSSRAFSNKVLNLQALSNFLYYSLGLRDNKYRYYPSGGSRYPLETYIFSLNTDLDKGIYHYYVKSHLLEQIGDFDKEKLFSAFNQRWLAKAACLIVTTAVFKRVINKYGDRGYRHILTEAGHMSQNMYLVSAAQKLACCSIGGYKEPVLDSLLDINSAEESVINVLAIGGL